MDLMHMQRRSDRRLASHPLLLALLALVVAALVATGCGGDGGGSSTSDAAPAESASEAEVTDAQVGETIAQAVRAPVAQEELSPVIVESLKRASAELSPEQLDKAVECWQQPKCQLGDGDVTLGIADGFGDNTWREFTRMEIILQALTYAEIGSVIYTDAKGDVSLMGSNIRSMAAQGVDVMVGHNDFGPAAAPAFRRAQQSGIPISTYLGGAPEVGTDAIAVQVIADDCEVGEQMIDTVVETAGESAKVAFFEGVAGNPQDARWQKCARDKIEKEGLGVEVVFEADTSWTPAGVFDAASSLIASNKDADAILYSFADPLTQVVDAYQKAGKAVPALVTYTENNGLLRAWEQADPTFPLFTTSGVNWPARVSVTAVMKIHGGEKVKSPIYYPMPFVEAKTGDYQADRPADFPGNSTLVPEQVIERMLEG